VPSLVSRIGWILLGAAAATGVAISVAVLLAWSPVGRPGVASLVMRALDGAIAGKIALDGITVLPSGGVELTGVRVTAPDGRAVLRAHRAKVHVDVTRLRARTIGLAIELEGVEVDLSRGADGSLALASAFAPPARSRPAGGPGERPAPEGAPGWTLTVGHLAIRDGSVRMPASDGEEWLVATGLQVDAAGEVGAGRARAELALRGRLDAPLAAALSLDLAGSLDGGAVSIPLLAARVGENVLEAVAEGDLGRRTGRLAATRLGIVRAEAAALVPGAEVTGGDLRGTGFAASDGRLASAAVRLEPAVEGGSGEADVAAATWLPPAPAAIGFDVRARGIDPSRVASTAPPGRVTLEGRGAISGRGAARRARIDAKVAPSVLRGASIGPAEIVASAQGDDVRVERLQADVRGAHLSASGRWRREGPVSGEAALDARDLRRAAEALEALLGTPMPPLAGNGTARLALSGTADEPRLAGTVVAPKLSIGDVRAEAVRLDVSTSGTPRTGTGRVEGTVGSLVAGDLVARALHVEGEVARGGATLSLSAAVPRLGTDPVALRGEGRFGPRRASIVVSALALAYPGTRYVLAAPAEILLAGPSVDRLELVSGEQRLAVEGGRAPDGTLDARVVVSRIDLAALPHGVLPKELGLAGEVSVDARATGAPRRARVEGQVGISHGAIRGIGGLDAKGTVRWDDASRRGAGDLTIRRAAGGSLEASADLPLQIGSARGAEDLAARVRADGVVLEDVLRAAGVDLPLAGKASFSAELGGTSREPVLRATARLADATVAGLDGVLLDATLDARKGRATMRAAAARSDAPLATVEASAPADLARFLDEPAAASRALARAPLEGTLSVPGVDLAALAGSWGLPAELAGRLTGQASLRGSLAAPRGTATASVEGGAVAGYRDLGARIEAAADADRTRLAARATLAGTEILRADLSLAAPAERLGAEVAVKGEVVVPGASLAGAAGPDVPLAGTITGRATVSGTLGAPVAEATLRGDAVALGGRPLGALDARARYADRRATGTLDFRSAAGGTLAASASLGIDLSAGAEARALRDAPATVRVDADRLDLGFLAALAPGTVRSASGTVAVALEGSGPLSTLRPRGTIRLTGGHAVLLRYGEWTQGELAVALTDDAIDVQKLAVHRGAGRLEARAAVRGLGGGAPARVEGRATAKAFTFARDGMDLATVDAELTAAGTLADRKLDARVDVTQAVVKLPRQLPRELQSLERRSDIVVGRREASRGKPAPGGGAKAGPSPAGSFEAVVRVVAPNRLSVRSDAPRVAVDLEADVTFELARGELYAEGEVQTLRGMVEPISGRHFDLEHGRVQFTGGPPAAAVLDVKAVYDNPTAKVTVLVTGPLRKPEITLSSDPPLDDAAIAMLIATGQADVKAGSAAVGTLNAEEAGRAALGAVVTQVFNGMVAGKLPLDSVGLDATTLRAGKYVAEGKVYVGYVRRFDAKPEKGENTDEVQVEYRITPRWKLQMSYGTAGTGAASLLWSKDY
jgi:translocation and assembly module TamB